MCGVGLSDPLLEFLNVLYCTSNVGAANRRHGSALSAVVVDRDLRKQLLYPHTESEWGQNMRRPEIPKCVQRSVDASVE